MSEDTPSPPLDGPTPTPASGRESRAWTLPGPKVWLLVILATAVILGLASVGLRYGPNTVSGRSLIERQLNGLKIARFGRLQVEGLRGDLWREASVTRLALVDAEGV